MVGPIRFEAFAMTPAVKLSGEERRASIIHAVRHLFANKGFKGTTTRELAEAAGVSEALLYRHFPTKEGLFTAIQQSFCDDQSRARFERLSSLEPSTQTLVLLTHFLVSQILGGEGDLDEQVVRRRMMLRSLAEDGEFARLILQPVANVLVPKIDECLRVAVSVGDAAAGHVLPTLAGWFAYNLSVMSSMLSVQNPPAVDFGVPRSHLVGQVVWFSLRGMGLHEEAIRRHYQPEALSALGI
jgi:AcrR family transcriptional regulator